MEHTSCHGNQNFEVAPRFLDSAWAAAVNERSRLEIIG
jgi:hypothetical protein